MKLSDTQRVILSLASQREDRIAVPPAHLPAGARQKVAAALVRQGLVSDEHASAYDARDAWQVEGRTRLLRITDAGLRAIGVAPEDADAAPTAPAAGENTTLRDDDAGATAPAQDAPVAADDAEPDDEEDDRPRHERLGIDEALIYGPPEEWKQPLDDVELFEKALVEREARKLMRAAHALLTAWDDARKRDADIMAALDGPMAALRATLAGKTPRAARAPGAPRKPREGTKQEAVLALLRRPEGATIAQICDVTKWQGHTARGFLAALKQKGITIEVIERVRHVGPGKEGARGSYSVYRAVG